MSRLNALIRFGAIGRLDLVRELSDKIQRTPLEILRRSEFDVVGSEGEMLRPGQNYVMPKGILGWINESKSQS